MRSGLRPRRNVRRPNDQDYGYYLQGAQESIFGPYGTSHIDDFNNGPNQNLTARAPWDPATVFTTMQTDSVPSYATGTALAYTGNTTLLQVADGEAWMQMSAVATEAYVLGRFIDNNNYYAVSNTGNAYVVLHVKIAGVDTTINVAQTISADDSLGLTFSGPSLAAWYKSGVSPWVQLLDMTDSVLTTGALGIEMYSNVTHVNVFGGGPVNFPLRYIPKPVIVHRTWAGR